jgi:hypothetical protein
MTALAPPINHHPSLIIENAKCENPISYVTLLPEPRRPWTRVRNGDNANLVVMLRSMIRTILG